MKTIWKFPLQATIAMPTGAKILSVNIINDAVYLWAEVDDEQPIEQRAFVVHGTGHDITHSINTEYVGTYLQYGGSLVRHVYEVLNTASKEN